MPDGLRTIRLVSSDESLVAAARSAVKQLGGYEFASTKASSDLVLKPPVAGDVILLDAAMREGNVYEICRSLLGRTRCRTFIVVDRDHRYAQGIAHFCGATGTLEKPLSAAGLRQALDASGAPRPELPHTTRSDEPKQPVLPQQLLRDLSGAVDTSLVSALTDPETNLFNYSYLNYKLDEEFKRAQRFTQPLSLVMLGFEGEASEQTLRELSGIFLSASRDTDLLGRFDASSFLFLLPSTGPDGAQIMAKRVEEQARQANLRDLVGDPLQLSVGIAFCPHALVRRREDLFGRARKALLDAQKVGGGVVTAS